MVDMARALIKAGHVYADNTEVDRMREERMAGTPSQCRGQAADETLRIFDEEMLKGTEVRRCPLHLTAHRCAAVSTLRPGMPTTRHRPVALLEWRLWVFLP